MTASNQEIKKDSEKTILYWSLGLVGGVGFGLIVMLFNIGNDLAIIKTRMDNIGEFKVRIENKIQKHDEKLQDLELRSNEYQYRQGRNDQVNNR